MEENKWSSLDYTPLTKVITTLLKDKNREQLRVPSKIKALLHKSGKIKQFKQLEQE
jgi:hypothetical protein